MCGIFGISGGHQEIDLTQINDLLKHRGPDDFGIYSNEFISLLHRRLSILDLSELGHQPMFSKCGHYVIVFNGEIYNHWEIRNELLGKYEFISTSDTETLLYAFMEYGETVLSKLNGIFAFAIYNITTNELFIARDHLGVKPLYYSCNEKQLIFSSEYKAILSLIEDHSLDYHGILNYLYFLWSPGQRTPFTQIHKLLPGHYIKYNNHQRLEVIKYYEIPLIGSYKFQSTLTWMNEIEFQILKSIQSQLLSDVPVGFFLSGGLDSSLIVAMAAKLNPNSKLKCYTIGSDANYIKEGFVDDLHYAKRVAELYNIELIEVVNEIDFAEEWDRLIWHLEEPQSDTAPGLVSNICRRARADGCYVLMSGTGGDDLFSGYRRHQSIAFQQWLRRLPLAKMGLQLLTLMFEKKHPIGRRIYKFYNSFRQENTDTFISNSFAWYDLDQLKKLFKPEIRQYIQNINPEDYLKESLNNIPFEKSNLNKMLYLDIKYFLADHNLNYTDKLSMAHGIEVRVPYLDKDLVELTTQIPISLKMKGQTTKFILRKIAEKYLPKDIIYRSKSGFGSPVRQLISHELREFVDDRLSKVRLDDQNIFNVDEVHKLIKDNLDQKVDGSYIILSLLAIESVIRQFR